MDKNTFVSSGKMCIRTKINYRYNHKNNQEKSIREYESPLVEECDIHTNKKTGKKNKALPIMIIEGGYKEFKALVGRKNSTVNFYLRGRLQTDFATSFKRSGSKWITGLKNRENSLKHDGLVKKYGADVWDISTVERRYMVSEFGKLGIKVLGK